MKKGPLLTIELFAVLVCAIGAQTMKAGSTSHLTAFQGQLIPIQPGYQLRFLALSKESVIGGTPLSGRVGLTFLAPKGGTRVRLSLSPDSILPEDLANPIVQLPATVQVPEREAQASFPIITFPVLAQRHITVEASAGGVTKTASFTIDLVRVDSLVIVPPAALGPFQAQGTVRLNVPAAADTNVRLTSSNPEVVRFGTVGQAQAEVTLSFHQNDISKSFPLVASTVPQNTAVTISASLNGTVVSRTVTVRH
jgi:hypothetical protein